MTTQAAPTQSPACFLAWCNAVLPVWPWPRPPELRGKSAMTAISSPLLFHASVPLHKAPMKTDTFNEENFLTTPYKTILFVGRPVKRGLDWKSTELEDSWDSCGVFSQVERPGLLWLWDRRGLDWAWARPQTSLGCRAWHSFLQFIEILVCARHRSGRALSGRNNDANHIRKARLSLGLGSEACRKEVGW